MNENQEQPKKILFLITKATWGGAQKYVYDLATNLPKHTFEPMLAFGVSGKLSQDLAEKGLSGHSLPSLNRDIGIFSDMRSFFEIYSCLKKVRPHVVHLNSSKAAALGALAARLSGVPRIVFTVHGWPFKEERGLFQRCAFRLISWLTAVLSHVTICVSRSDEALGKRMPLVKKKVHYIPLGIDPPAFKDRTEAATLLHVAAQSPRVVTSAELTKNKGIRYAIDAIALLKKNGTPLHYYVIGDGELRKELESYAQERGVSDEVHFLGFIHHAAEYLRAFDVFVLPSIKEGMPYVLLEAAFADLPIVATNIIDPAFAQRYPSVKLVEAKNPSALARAISAACKERPRYPEYPALEGMVQKTIEYYR